MSRTILVLMFEGRGCTPRLPAATAAFVGEGNGADRASNDADVSIAPPGFGTVGFPQYGFKVGLSEGVFPARRPMVALIAFKPVCLRSLVLKPNHVSSQKPLGFGLKLVKVLPPSEIPKRRHRRR